MRKTIIMTIAAAALPAGCEGGDSAEATAHAIESSTSATAPESATAAAPSTTAQAMDAETALATLKDAGLPITDSAVITETNDANDLIGRPGQYVSEVAFAGNRVGVRIDPAEPGNEGGGSIEVFADDADAQVRSDYIQEALQSLGRSLARNTTTWPARSSSVSLASCPRRWRLSTRLQSPVCPETTKSLTGSTSEQSTSQAQAQ